MNARRLMGFVPWARTTSCKPNTILERQLWHCIAARHASRCPLWVKSGHRGVSTRCPLYPRKQTSLGDHHFRFVPTAVMDEFYWIISSARPSNESGTVRPRTLAVLRLTISSTFVACWTGRSAGFSPFRMRPRKIAAWRYKSGWLIP